MRAHVHRSLAMLADPALRAPRRYALLALVLVLPSLGLAVLAGWTLVLDRQAAEAEARSRARSLSLALVNTLNGAVAGSSGSGSEEGVRLVLTADQRLARPRPGIWPPQPGSGAASVPDDLRERWLEAQVALDGQEWSVAGELLNGLLEAADREGRAGTWVHEVRWWRGLVWRSLGEDARAIDAWHRAWSLAPVDAVTSVGVSIRDLALGGILEVANGDPGRLPVEWLGQDGGWLVQVADEPTTPLAEATLERVRALLPQWVEEVGFPGGLSAAEAPFRRREQVRRVYATLAESRTFLGDGRAWVGRQPRSWGRSMQYELDREVWVAVEREGESDVEGEGETSRAGSGSPMFFGSDGRRSAASLPGIRSWELHRWAHWVEAVRGLAKVADPQGHFGWSIRVEGDGFSMGQEEPAEVFGRPREEGEDVMGWLGALEQGRIATVERSVGPADLEWTVGVALMDPTAHFAAQERRRWLLYGLVMAACGVSSMAALLVWRTLVRQHRLGVAKSNLLASVSHELRAPLASVRLLADNLERDRVSEPERRRESLRLIGRECRRLGALVDNVLDLSRLERGVRRLDRQSTDLTALVRETARVAEVTGEERGLRVEVVMEGEGESVVGWVEGRWVQQALANLLDNALKHAPEGSAVRVTLRRVDEGRVRLEVEDSGPGIPEAERERVFEPFYRRGSELRRETPGVGIGLAVVRQVAVAHGGRVWLEGVEPSGVRAVLELRVGVGESGGSDGSDRLDGSWGRLKV